VADLFSQRFDVPFFVTKLILVFCYKSRRQLHLQGFTHAYSFIFKVAALAGLLALTGCASKIAAPEQYSGF
jgi:hypothetical protein